ncbi:MAG: hypothetical protein HFJ50_00685 [Clostridia bacterium]|nr:hypothetical protein [Clostridia bacterium]
MLKNKAILLYTFLALIMILSFAIPKWIIKIQDKKILSNKYTVNKKIQTLSENAKWVGLIETIYSKYNTDKYNVKISDIASNSEIIIIQDIENNITIKINVEDSNDIEDTLKKFQELIKLNIIVQDFYNQFSYQSITYRIWDYDNGKIKYKTIKIFIQDALEEFIASIDIENETNKIIAYTVKKEYANIMQETLKEYAKYLELYNIFDDWEYRDNELKSKTSGIKITGNIDDRYIYVKVVPFEA